LCYTALLSPMPSRPDALAVVDLDAGSPTYGQVLHRLDMPNVGDEFHHFGWNACSSALHADVGPRLRAPPLPDRPGHALVALYIVDTQPGPRTPTIVKVIEPEEVLRKTGYSRPHTCTAGPKASTSARWRAGKDGTDGPPGVFVLDCESFDILGKWEIDRGPQKLHYDFWWNLPRDWMVSSEWGLPPQFENGIVPEDLLSNKYGHQLHFWDLRGRKHLQTIDLGANHQMALEVRPAHDPTREYGFVGVVVDTTNLEASIWTWWREDGRFHARKTATIPPEPADKVAAAAAAAGLRRRAAAGERHRPLARRPLPLRGLLGHRRAAPVRRDRSRCSPKLAGSVRIGGIARTSRTRAARPSAAARRWSR
jgi:selenium-binding protein 1